MNPLIQLKTTAPLLIALALLGFALSPTAQAVVPAPDGGYPGGNTAEGQNALLNLTTGGYNTAVGFLSLQSDTTGQLNTGIGAGTLAFNAADNNTATGFAALLSNGTGLNNTANGTLALLHNTAGGGNTATGYRAMFNNISGGSNTANGESALESNTDGNYNTAIGVNALGNNDTGNENIGLGFTAGGNLHTGDHNIYVANLGGGSNESGTIRIGDNTFQTATFIAGISGATVPNGVTVFVNGNGRLGTMVSSARFKEEIKPMGSASEAILALKPVSFRYKQEIDPNGIPQFGLVAEDVEKVNPALVLPDKEGKPYTVRYDQVNAMLLNEFIKEHRKVEEQQATITDLRSTVAQQRKDLEATAAQQQQEIQALTATVNEQAAQIHKVSAKLEASKPAPQMVNNP